MLFRAALPALGRGCGAGKLLDRDRPARSKIRSPEKTLLSSLVASECNLPSPLGGEINSLCNNKLHQKFSVLRSGG